MEGCRGAERAGQPSGSAPGGTAAVWWGGLGVSAGSLSAVPPSSPCGHALAGLQATCCQDAQLDPPCGAAHGRAAPGSHAGPPSLAWPGAPQCSWAGAGSCRGWPPLCPGCAEGAGQQRVWPGQARQPRALPPCSGELSTMPGASVTNIWWYSVALPLRGPAGAPACSQPSLRLSWGSPHPAGTTPPAHGAHRSLGPPGPAPLAALGGLVGGGGFRAFWSPNRPQMWAWAHPDGVRVQTPSADSSERLQSGWGFGAPSPRNLWGTGLAWASLVDMPHGRGCRAWRGQVVQG